MRTPRPALVLLLCVLIPASLSAQQSTPPAPPPLASDPQAVALLQKALAALTGGLPVTDVTLTGSARRIAGSDDETGTATLKATSLGDSRVDLVLPSGNRSEIRNHSALPLPGSFPVTSGLPSAVAQTPQQAGAWSGPDGITRAMISHNTFTDPSWFFPVFTLTKLVSPNYVLSYVGQETTNGNAVVHISASQRFPATSNVPANLASLPQNLSQMDVYIDPVTSLPVALAFSTHPDANALIDIPTQIEFSNYQSTNGVHIALHIQKFLNNNLLLDLQFTNAAINSGLAADIFQLQ